MTITDTGPNLSDSDVLELEARLRFTLPDAYRSFLLEFNGGISVPDTIHIDGLPGSPTDVQVFFGIGRAEETEGIEWNLASLSERLEEQLLPIACDSGGSVFCLSLRPHDYGAVFFADLQEVFADFETRRPRMYWIAPDFGGFLQMLRPFD